MDGALLRRRWPTAEVGGREKVAGEDGSVLNDLRLTEFEVEERPSCSTKSTESNSE